MRFFYKLISLIFLANFFAFSSKAEISLSGYQEFFAGSADQTRTTALDNSTGASTNNSYSGFSDERMKEQLKEAKKKAAKNDPRAKAAAAKAKREAEQKKRADRKKKRQSKGKRR